VSKNAKKLLLFVFWSLLVSSNMLIKCRSEGAKLLGGFCKEKCEFLKDIYKQRKFFIVGVIGDKHGAASELLLKDYGVKKLYCMLDSMFGEIENVQGKLSNFSYKATLIKSDIKNALNSFEDGFLDFILLDDYFSESEKDLVTKLCLKKIKRGGAIACFSRDVSYVRNLKKTLEDNGFHTRKCSNNQNFVFAIKPHKLSFVIPCYNRAHTIRRAIDSIYEQDLDIPFEVVCTDDASQDRTKEILLEYQEKYFNFKVYFHKVNKGASEARNTCIAKSDGDLIFTLDSDNFLEPRTVGKLVDLLDATGYDVASFKNRRFFKGSVKNWNNELMYAGNRGFYDLCDFETMSPVMISSGNYLFTRKSYERAGRYVGRVLETCTFGFRQLATGSKIAVLQGEDKNFYWHSYSNDSKWLSNQKGNKNYKTMLKELKNHEEVFDSSTRVFLKNNKTNGGSISRDIKNGMIKLIPKNILDNIFDVYWFYENNMYEETLLTLAKIEKHFCGNKLREIALNLEMLVSK